jgi:hypothetical protein
MGHVWRERNITYEDADIRGFLKLDTGIVS